MQVQVSKTENTKSKDDGSKGSKSPIAKFSAGGINAAIWQNERKEGISYSTVTLDKRYKSGEEWKSTKSMGVGDLPKAMLVLRKAYEFLALKEQDT